MAMNDVETKLLGKLAKQMEPYSPLLSSVLYKLLGLSVMLSRRLVRARQVRKLDTTRDTKSLALYHHIIFLAREGLSMTETYVVPFSDRPGASAELRVFAAKLRASFYHVFCLFHNTPPVNSLIPTSQASQGPPQSGPLSPKQDNGQKTRRSTEGAPGSNPKQTSGDDKENTAEQQQRQSTPSRARQAALRDTIPSMVSEASYITNPYVNTVTPPPGLKPLPSIPQPATFLLPALNYVPNTQLAFARAIQLAQSLLPGSAPLRLSVSLEYCAFLWDCLHDYEGCRRAARKTIQEVYRAEEGMDDAEFEDAKTLVGTLGRMMRRQPSDSTPKLGAETPPTARDVGVNVSVPPVPDVYMSGTGTTPRNQATTAGPASPSRRAPAPNPTSPTSRRGGNGSSTTPKGSPPRTPRQRGNGNGNGRSPRGSGGGGGRKSGEGRGSNPRDNPTKPSSRSRNRK